MQMCGECGKVYDESEYSRCPYCYGFYYKPKRCHGITVKKIEFQGGSGLKSELYNNAR
jgi:hypothetical protein